MKAESLRKMLLPPGPVLSLTLIGLLLLSAVLYYRAVNIQRFLEPALAISQPRMEFAENLSRLLVKEFSTEDSKGVLFTADTIFIDESLLYVGVHHMEGTSVVKKLSRVFLSVLEDPDMRPYIELIMVGTRLPLSADQAVNKRRRLQIQHKAELILSSLYKAEPRLESEYGMYFAATALPVDVLKTQTNWVEFRIVPTLRLHIDVLQKLEKYAR